MHGKNQKQSTEKSEVDGTEYDFKCGVCNEVYISVSSLAFIQKSLCTENGNSSEANVI